MFDKVGRLTININSREGHVVYTSSWHIFIYLFYFWIVYVCQV